VDKPIEKNELRILMLEDVSSDAALEESELRGAELMFTLLRVDTRAAFERALDEFKPSIILADYNLPAYSGRDALEYTRRTHPLIPVIMVTGAMGDEVAVELLKQGASDYVLKDRLARLVPAIKRALLEAQDIRIRKQAEEALLESEERFRKMSDSAQDAIIMMDADGKISFWNKAAEMIFGYSIEEALGQALHDLVAPPSKYAEIKKGWAYFSASGKGAIIGKVRELVARRKGGDEFPVELSVSAVQLGGRWCSIGIVRDITERKQTDDALRQINRTLRTLSAGNVALVKAVDEVMLLDEICRIIVDIGEYGMAWVGYADENEEKSITLMACKGVARSDLIALQLTWGDSARGQCTLAGAIRSGQLQISRDILKESSCDFCHQLAVAHGWSANLSVPLADGGRVFGALSIFSGAPNAFDADERALLNELGGDLAYGICALRTSVERDQAAEKGRQYLEQIRNNLIEALQALASTVEMRDPYTAGHEKRVSELAVAIGQELHLTREQLDAIYFAGNVHDIGKIKVPAEILSKPGALSELEFGLIKLHPETGYEILKGINFPWPVATIVWQHHERLNGTGYPRGLKGDQIILEAQILAVADVVESILSHRPYRPALGLDVAINEIMDKRGKLYNANVVDACVRLFKERRFTFHEQ
jgi:PAS domain S-box-containing protein